MELDFSQQTVRGRSAGGNLVTKYSIRKIEMSEAGVSTLGKMKVWYDETVRTLNSDGRGSLLGEFKADDRIVVYLSTGEYLLSGFDLNTRFDDKMIKLEKWNAVRPVSVVYFEGEKQHWYVKRFLPEMVQKPFRFIGDHEQSRLGIVTSLHHPMVRIRFNRRFKETRDREDELIDLQGFIAVKGLRALGNRLNSLPVTEVLLEPENEALEKTAEAGLALKDEALEANTSGTVDEGKRLKQTPVPGVSIEKKEPESKEEKNNLSQTDSDQPTLF
jgi:topoisomerase-4 subunit A